MTGKAKHANKATPKTKSSSAVKGKVVKTATRKSASSAKSAPKYKFSSVKDMFKTIKRKQQENESEAKTQVSVAEKPYTFEEPKSVPSSPTTPAQSPPIIKRNLFGVRLDHNQLNRDLKEMWQEQIERQKVQWNFDFEKIKPVADSAALAATSKITRSRTRSTSLGDRLAASHEPNTDLENKEECIVDKRYEWKKINTQLVNPSSHHVTTRYQQHMQQLASTPMLDNPIPLDRTPMSSSSQNRSQIRPNPPLSYNPLNNSNYGMAISAFTESEIDREYEINNTETIYIYDDDDEEEEEEESDREGDAEYDEEEARRFEDDEEEEDEALAVPQFYKYQRVYKLNNRKDTTSLKTIRSPVFCQHKATNTSPSSSTTSEIHHSIFNMNDSKRNQYQRSTAAAAAAASSGGGRTLRKDLRKRTTSSVEMVDGVSQRSLIITFSENRKDTLRSAVANARDFECNAENSEAAAVSSSGFVPETPSKLKQQSILGDYFS
jgi:hypothetical protein